MLRVFASKSDETWGKGKGGEGWVGKSGIGKVDQKKGAAGGWVKLRCVTSVPSPSYSIFSSWCVCVLGCVGDVVLVLPFSISIGTQCWSERCRHGKDARDLVVKREKKRGW